MRTPLVILSALMIALQPGNSFSQSRHFPVPRRTDGNMSILISRLSGVEVVDEAEVACFTPADLIAGLTIIDANEEQWGMAVFGDDAITDTIDGFQHGEPLRFRYWDPVTDWERDVGFEVVEGGEAVYRANNYPPLIMDFTVGVTDNRLVTPSSFSLLPPFPNPFNSQSQIGFSLSRPGLVILSLYDSRGSLLGNLIYEPLGSGRHTLTLRGEGLPAGNYLLVLQQYDNRISRQLVLLK